MAIYTIGGIKGGSGKTTVATNLTVLLASEGRDVLLVDADDQETASDFTAWRNTSTEGQAGYTAIQLTGDAVRTEVRRLASKYDDIVIDTGGRDTTSQRAAMTVSDLYLVPFVPRSFDVWTLERVVKLIDEMRPANPALRAFAFLNRADAGGSDNDGAAEQLKDASSIRFIDMPLGSRKAFSNAAAEGRAVTELKRLDAKAVAEVRALYDFCRNVINNVENNVGDNVAINVGGDAAASGRRSTVKESV
jgi:chromosome partitioning protein